MTEQELLRDCLRRLNGDKLYWNRLIPSDRQLSDVAGVVAVQRGRLDLPYLRHWAAKIAVADPLEAALSGHPKLKDT